MFSPDPRYFDTRHAVTREDDIRVGDHLAGKLTEPTPATRICSRCGKPTSNEVIKWDTDTLCDDCSYPSKPPKRFSTIMEQMDTQEFAEFKRSRPELLMGPFDVVDVELAMRLSWIASRSTLRKEFRIKLKDADVEEINFKFK